MCSRRGFSQETPSACQAHSDEVLHTLGGSSNFKSALNERLCGLPLYSRCTFYSSTSLQMNNSTSWPWNTTLGTTNLILRTQQGATIPLGYFLLQLCGESTIDEPRSIQQATPKPQVPCGFSVLRELTLGSVNYCPTLESLPDERLDNSGGTHTECAPRLPLSFVPGYGEPRTIAYIDSHRNH
ncbi:hypothetical protein NA57DRAFT_59676 [Rhizodiscina lignyota]|uniref:Uncharacterized protein n=1 Tax=Rhizodiscina lignyota TaxID=1504668 RepID=A0A9P4I644_9PEZI|nr:hypothetical protein NA57DRAFT_59676 [Rhizodiscina lignyota]